MYLPVCQTGERPILNKKILAHLGQLGILPNSGTNILRNIILRFSTPHKNPSANASGSGGFFSYLLNCYRFTISLPFGEGFGAGSEAAPPRQNKSKKVILNAGANEHTKNRRSCHDHWRRRWRRRRR